MKAVVLGAVLLGALAALADPAPSSPPSAAPSAPAAPTSDGAKLWSDKRAKCVTCHGPDGKGDTKMGKQKKVKDMTTAEWQKHLTDQQMVDAIMKGIERDEDGRKVKMEPLKDGTEAEAKSLVAFIRTLGPK